MLREDPEASIKQGQETETNSDRDRDRDREQAGQGGLCPCPPSLSHSSLADPTVSSRLNHVLRADPELPFLDMAWSPSQMQQFFNQRLLPTVRPHWEATAVAIDDIAYEPGVKCEIVYSLQFGDPPEDQRQRVMVT